MHPYLYFKTLDRMTGPDSGVRAGAGILPAFSLTDGPADLSAA